MSISRWLDRHNVVIRTAGGLSAMKEDILTVPQHEWALKPQEIKYTDNENPHQFLLCKIWNI